MKPLTFIGSSLDDLRNSPDEARKAAGFELYSVQSGLDPTDWKPMPGIGRGVKEIRIHVLGGTSQQDVELARKRYKQIEQGG